MLKHNENKIKCFIQIKSVRFALKYTTCRLQTAKIFNIPPSGAKLCRQMPSTAMRCCKLTENDKTPFAFIKLITISYIIISTLTSRSKLLHPVTYTHTNHPLHPISHVHSCEFMNAGSIYSLTGCKLFCCFTINLYK